MLKSWVTGVGENTLTIGSALHRIMLGRIDWRETFVQIERCGIESLPIVLLSASFIGMALSVEFAREIITRYGAYNIVGAIVAISLVRELAPVFVAVVLAGNIGAAITAEIGTMQVTDQIDALKVFRIKPIDYLLVPRLIATAIVGPALTIFGCYMAIWSGQIFTEIMMNIPREVFWNSVKTGITDHDIINMLTKAFVFAIAVVLIASLNGLATHGSSEAVGRNTTKTVVTSLLSIFILNYILTSVFFHY